MRNRNFLLALAATMLFAASICHGVYIGSADRFLTLSQPNDVAFSASYWNDDFEWHMETEDGYSIIYKPSDGYYYYSQLDSLGEYTWTNLKVAIDSPNGLAQHLERSQSRMAYIDSLRSDFEQQCDSALIVFREWSANAVDRHMDVAVLLVETPDKQCTGDFHMSDFGDMLSSDDEYNTRINPLVHAPDGYTDVYGSVLDYFQEVSRKGYTPYYFEPYYTVVNNTDTQGYPVWLELDNNFGTYTLSELITEAIDEALANNLNLTGYQDICVIVADHLIVGEPGPSGVALPNYTYPGLSIQGAYYFWELWGTDYGNPGDPDLGFTQEYCFSHIGIHCHEYGHLLGLLYGSWNIFGGGNNNGRQFMLMGTGNNPGLKRVGECPSHMGVAEKLELGWVDPDEHITEITSNQIDAVIAYSTSDPDFYRFTCPNGDVFLLENRRYDGDDFNSYLDGYDQISFPQNMLLISRNWGTDYYTQVFLNASNYDINNGTRGNWWFTGHAGFPFPGTSHVDSLSPLSPEEDVTYPGNKHWDYHTTSKDHLSHQTGFALFNITSQADGIHADVYHNYWAGDINANTTWAGTDIIVGGPGVTVKAGYTLTISAGSTVTFRQGTYLKVEEGGHIIAEGTPSQQITFRSATSQQDGWNGIKLYDTNEGDVLFEHCVFMYTQSPNYAIFCDGGSFELNACTLDENYGGVYVLSGHDIQVTNCTISDADRFGFYASTTQGIDFNQNNVNHCAYGGMVLNTCSGVVLTYNQFNDNGPSPIYAYGGLYLDTCSPIMSYNTINYNDGRQLGAIDGSYPVMDRPTETGGINTLRTQVENHYPIYVTQSFPVMDVGHNNVINEATSGSHIVIYDATSSATGRRNVVRNYWGTADPLSSQFYPSSVEYYFNPHDDEFNIAPAGLCSLDDDSLKLLFNQACDLEEQGSYGQAIDIFKEICETYPDSLLGLASVVRIKDCAYLGGLNLESYVNYFLSLAAMPLNDEFCHRAYMTSISTKIHAGDYYGAIADYEDILLSGPTLQDSIMAVIDAGMAYLLAEQGGGQGLCGNGGQSGRIPALRPESIEDYHERITTLWALSGNWNPGASQINTVPDDFALHQNTPNPFNPSTSIRYELPEPARVTMTVYNMIGQTVAVLVEGQITAGVHNTTWDAGSNLPSGVYLCRFEAEGQETGKSFTATQKLLLLK